MVGQMSVSKKPPPESIQTRTYSIYGIHSASLWGLPLIDTPHDVANLYHIAVHNTLSLLLLRNAPLMKFATPFL